MGVGRLKRLFFGSDERLSLPSGHMPKSAYPSFGGLQASYPRPREDITALYSPSTRRESTQSNKFDSRTVSDATVGLADGLTVPFALTAGLSALGNPQVVVYGGLAELFAGAISMGLGGYLGGKHEKFVTAQSHDVYGAAFLLNVVLIVLQRCASFTYSQYILDCA